ncbi:MAG: hypothetical protein LQ338_005060 [Usnochroma carphineum]|nr:MAG: hypothetical protein LQ338_005060 [Usnochroma carphineum]
MKVTARLFAAVKSDRFLTAGNPTGLTGLLTHPAPRTQLLYLYSSTLAKLDKLPAYSVYRQSAEAITKHRLSIVENTKPQGYDEWAQRAQKRVKEHPEVFGEEADVSRIYVQAMLTREKNRLDIEWDGEKNLPPALEGTRTEEEKDTQQLRLQRAKSKGQELEDWENEPPLEASQVAEMEDKIGGGLIEEVIQVAEGEHKLVDTILESRSLIPIIVTSMSKMGKKKGKSAQKEPPASAETSSSKDSAPETEESSSNEPFPNVYASFTRERTPQMNLRPDQVAEAFTEDFYRREAWIKAERAAKAASLRAETAVKERDPNAIWNSGMDALFNAMREAHASMQPECLLKPRVSPKPERDSWLEPFPDVENPEMSFASTVPQYPPDSDTSQSKEASPDPKPCPSTQVSHHPEGSQSPDGAQSTTASPFARQSSSIKASPGKKTASRREAILRDALCIAKDIGSWAKEPGKDYDSSQLVRGVLISCTSIEVLRGTPRYTVYESPRRDLLTEFKPPNLSQRIELPLICFGSNHDIAKKQYANFSAEQVFRGEYTDDPDNLDSWGNLPLKVRNPGNVLVFRRDGKELLPQHVEAFVVWIPTVFAGHHFGPARKLKSRWRKEEQVKVFDERATRKNFEAFWEYWKGLDARWKELKSPYEM